VWQQWACSLRAYRRFRESMPRAACAFTFCNAVATRPTQTVRPPNVAQARNRTPLDKSRCAEERAVTRAMEVEEGRRRLFEGRRAALGRRWNGTAR